MDLYQLNLNKDDIIGFNKEFDNLTVIVKTENKIEMLKQLSILYDYISKFVDNMEFDEIDKVSFGTKNNIYKAYSKLDTKDWNIISQDVQNAIDVFSKILTNTEIEQNKQYFISKIYVMLNELQNAITLQDESIFLIKYKNIVEEFNNI